MAMNILTLDDLDNFKIELFDELKTVIFPEFKKEILNSSNENFLEYDGKRWLKSYQVMRMLGVSSGTLQNLRINRTIPFTKIGGSLYYPYDGIMKLFKDNMTDAH